MSRLQADTNTPPILGEAGMNLLNLCAAGALPVGDPSALALTSLAACLAPRLSLGSSLAGMRVAWERLRARHAGKARLRSALGIDLHLTAEECALMHDEVRRFQWIEAERAGRNIWAERNAADPEGAALVEWFRRHFGAWYLSRRKPQRAG